MGANCSRSSSNDVLDTSDPLSYLGSSSSNRRERSSRRRLRERNSSATTSSEQPSWETQRTSIARDHLFPLDSGLGSRRYRGLTSASSAADPMPSLFGSGSGSRGRRGRGDDDGIFSSGQTRSAFGAGSAIGGGGLDGFGGLGGSLFGSGLPRGAGASSFHTSRWGGASSLLHESSPSTIGDSIGMPGSSSLTNGASAFAAASSISPTSSSLSSRSGGGVLGRRRASEEQRRNRELEEIERLQQDLAVMEAFFQTLLGRWAAMAEGGGGNGGLGGGGGGNGNSPPPASELAVQRLPTVVATAEDLVEESNRECCICFVDIHLGNEVSRLPCGHLYHENCISEWLLKHCTCPVCRYELPTDDVDYEQGRIERMRDRKPRYRRYELDRMSVQELRELAASDDDSLSDDDLSLDKNELVERIIASGRFDIINNPDLVEYKLSDLRSMGVNDLRSAMTNAGVFFNPGDVVEKEDMVQMFMNSGRLMVLPEQRHSCSCSCSSDTSSDNDQKMSATNEEEGEGEEEAVQA